MGRSGFHVLVVPVPKCQRHNLGSAPDYSTLSGQPTSPAPRHQADPLHNLRHSHASQLLRAGINAKVISERLGHSRVAFTLDVYAHLMPGMQDEASAKTDVARRAAIEKQNAARA
jgi:hypothetical protein